MPRLLPDKINLDVNTLEGIPGKNYSRRYQTPSLIRRDQRVTPPALLHRPAGCSLRGQGEALLLALAGECAVLPKEVFAYPGTANLFLYGADNLGGLLDDEQAAREYEAVLLNWAVKTVRGADLAPVLGFADDNYRDGTQSFIYSFISPDIAQNYGLTTTEIHEFGHHLNLSHPFDGFDYENQTDFGWDGKYYFTGVGNEVNSMMSYVDLNWDFSQFDRDNTDRFQAAACINNANALARKIQNDPDAGQAAAELAAADAAYGEAKAALARHDYDGTFEKARETYEHALQGARDAGVPVSQAIKAGRPFEGSRHRARYRTAT